MIVYIAGKMAGLPNLGKEKFMAAAEKLQADGYTVLNPAELPDGMYGQSYMPICLAMIEQADAVYALNNWNNSSGALIEVQYARYQGKEIIYEPMEISQMKALASILKTTNYHKIIRRTPEEMAELITAIISERDKTWLEKLAAAGIEAEIIEMPAKSVANHLAWLCEEADT